MKKVLAIVMALTLILGLFSGCNGFSGKPGGSATVSGTIDENGKWKPDLSKTIDIELMEKGWVNTPTGGNEKDPYWKWLKDTFNINLKLTNTSEFETSITVRFASNSPPDIISFADANTMRSLYKQGVLIDDWTPYLDKMPTVDKNIGELARSVFTQENKLIVLPGKEVTNNYGFRIRKDWLDTLNLDIPTDLKSLLNVARAFTTQDPDGNGKNDTYAFSSAGGGTSLGEIANLLLMWGPNNFYIKDNKVTHPIIDGNLEKFLQFLGQIVDEGLIDPDWYIQGWEQRKGQMYKGTYGILWYTGALITEIEYNTGNTGKTAEQWVTLPMPKVGEDGGKLMKGDLASYITSVSSKAAADSDTLARIIYLIESVTYPNEGFYQLRYGNGFDYTLVDAVIDGKETGYKYLSEGDKNKQHYRSDKGTLGSADYGTWIDVDTFRVVHSSFDKATPALLKQIELEEDIVNAETYNSEHRCLVLDAKTNADATNIYNEYVIKYILKESNESYASFQKRWLDGGGQNLLDQATEQFKTYGYLK